MTPDPIKEFALVLLGTMADRKAKYDALNDSIRELQGDFASHVSFMDDGVWLATVKLIDAILDDYDIAEYFLCEVPFLKGDAFIEEEDGQRWPLETIADVRSYVMREQKTPERP